MPNNINCGIGKNVWYCVYNANTKMLQTAFHISPGVTLIDNSTELENYNSFITDERQALIDHLLNKEINYNNIEIPE